MFTGIVEEIGTIKSIKHGSKSAELVIGAVKVLEDIKLGDSINTNGICLTVTNFNLDSFTVDVMPETVRRTNLKDLKSGSKVNLERALRLSDRLGGHLVSGHIDGVGVVRKTWEDDIAIWYTIGTDNSILKYVVEKGSIAIDGISLTVANVDHQSFNVSVIPHTQSVTALNNRKVGDTVNVECDIIAKYVEKLAGHGGAKGNITEGFLAENGFM